VGAKNMLTYTSLLIYFN